MTRESEPVSRLELWIALFATVAMLLAFAVREFATRAADTTVWTNFA